MKTIPCEECISFAICNSTLDRYDGSYKAIIVSLMPKCETLKSFVFKGNLFLKKIRQVAALYGLKKDCQ